MLLVQLAVVTQVQAVEVLLGRHFGCLGGLLLERTFLKMDRAYPCWGGALAKTESVGNKSAKGSTLRAQQLAVHKNSQASHRRSCC